MDKDINKGIAPAQTLYKRVAGLIRRFWSMRFVRFLFVGGINTLFGYSIFSALILLRIHYAIASLLATIFGIVFNFFTTGRIVFNNRDPKLILKFFGVYGVIYLINLIMLKIFDSYQVNMLIAGAILIFPMAVMSYFLNKVFVFRK